MKFSTTDRSLSKSWALGAAGGALAAAPASGEIVQITQVDNILSNQGLRPNLDFTGDGVADASSTFSTTSTTFTSGPTSTNFYRGSAILFLNPFSFTFFPAAGALARTTGSAIYGYTAYAGLPPFGTGTSSSNPVEARGLFPIQFIDSRINGGALTEAIVELEARNEPGPNFAQAVEILRVIFDDSSTFIDPDDVEDDLPEFVPSAGTPDSVIRQSIRRKIARLNRKIRQAKARGDTRRVLVLKRKVRALKRRLSSFLV
ncbi:MAG: hypothetical protein AAGC68_06215 [Verrucomicrobiota bacterium]